MLTKILTCVTVLALLNLVAVSPNLLQGGTATQSSTSGAQIADWAVDGDLDTIS